MGLIIGEITGLLAVVLVFAIPLSFSPVGKALAERLRGGRAPDDLDRRIRDLEAEVQQLREIIVMGEAARRPPGRIAEPEGRPAEPEPAARQIPPMERH